MCGPVDQREDQQDRDRRACAASSGSGTASSCGASRRRPGRGADGASGVVRMMFVNSTAAARQRGRAREPGSSARTVEAAACAARRASPLGPRRRRSLAAGLARLAQLVLQALDLLQDALELVLGAGELAREARARRGGRPPAGCAPRGRRGRADLHGRPGRSRRPREQLAEGSLVDEVLERLGGLRLGVLVERCDLSAGVGWSSAILIGAVPARGHGLSSTRNAADAPATTLGEIIRRQRELNKLSMRQFARDGRGSPTPTSPRSSAACASRPRGCRVDRPLAGR